jgi:hypothetical protein
MQILTTGDYRVTVSGEVAAYIDPQLTFGHETSLGGWFELAFVIFLGGLAAVIAAGRIVRREARRPGPEAGPPAAGSPQTISGIPGHATSVATPRPARLARPAPSVVLGTPAVAPAGPEDVVLIRLDKLADLHERGALTDAEFAAEKAKILDR